MGLGGRVRGDLLLLPRVHDGDVLPHGLTRDSRFAREVAKDSEA